MMNKFVSYLFVLLCCSITKSYADNAHYYYDYECNEALVASSKLTATSSLRDRGPDNAKLYGELLHYNAQVRRRYKSVNQWVEHFLSTKFTNMEDRYNVRWAFNAKMWKPTYSEILAASSYIQTEEKERIAKFVFQDDAKSSLLGRLMLRKFVHLATSMPYNEVCFSRDSHGKPYLVGAGDVPISFNISHQADYVVLAGHPNKSIAIDIMKTEAPANKNIPEFFRLMNRQFSAQEWKTIRSYPTEAEQIECFYRIWCLKESYVKNTGSGITVALDQISFDIQTRKLQVGEFVTNTTMFERSVLNKNWVFEETLLHEKFAVAVSLRPENQADHKSVPYHFLTFDELVREAKPLQEPCTKFSADFMKKKEKPSY